MTKRAKKAMTDLYNASENPAIAALVEFAAQNSGIDWRDYGTDTNGRRAYREEVRSIGRDWKRFREVLAIAAAEGVKDKHVIAEAPHAFSGRLTWSWLKGQCRKCFHGERHTETECTMGAWEYCTGQYFPTEYRKAAAVLLEYATRAVRQSRPAEKRAVKSIAELKALNEKNGGCWFGKGEMRWHADRVRHHSRQIFHQLRTARERHAAQIHRQDI